MKQVRLHHIELGKRTQMDAVFMYVTLSYSSPHDGSSNTQMFQCKWMCDGDQNMRCIVQAELLKVEAREQTVGDALRRLSLLGYDSVIGPHPDLFRAE